MELIRAKLEDSQDFIDLESNFSNLKTYSNMTDPEEVVEQIKNSIVYFIKIGEEKIGSVSYEKKSSDHFYIDGLIILPKFQGQGYGREAMQKVLTEIGSVKRIDLVTHPQNERAIKLYESLGFKIESRKENYFGDGEPRVVMAKMSQ